MKAYINSSEILKFFGVSILVMHLNLETVHHFGAQCHKTSMSLLPALGRLECFQIDSMACQKTFVRMTSRDVIRTVPLAFGGWLH